MRRLFSCLAALALNILGVTNSKRFPFHTSGTEPLYLDKGPKSYKVQ